MLRALVDFGAYAFRNQATDRVRAIADDARALGSPRYLLTGEWERDGA